MNEIKKIIIETLEEQGIFIELEEDVNLLDYNIDSITFMTIIIELESQLNIEFPDELLSYDSLRSLNGFATLILELKKNNNK